MDFCLLLNIWVKNTDKNISTNLSRKCIQNLTEHAEESAQDTPKTISDRVIQNNRRTN